MYAIPQIIAAGLILIVAYVVSRFVGRFGAELVSGAGVDEIPMKLDVQPLPWTNPVSDIIGCLIVFLPCCSRFQRLLTAWTGTGQCA